MAATPWAVALRADVPETLPAGIWEQPTLTQTRRCPMLAEELPHEFVRRVRSVHWKALAFDFFVVPWLLLVYWTVVAQGWRIATTSGATKLFKTHLGLIPFLKNKEILRQTDLAHVYAVLLLFAVTIFGVLTVKIIFFGGVRKRGVKNQERMDRFVVLIAVIVFVVDGAMFFHGIREVSFFHKSGVVTPLLVTLGYSAMLAAFCFLHVYLRLEDES
jgi:hypothetical protein